MMSGEAWLYLLAVLINAVNLFLQVFFTIMSVGTLHHHPSIHLATPITEEEENHGAARLTEAQVL